MRVLLTRRSVLSASASILALLAAPAAAQTATPVRFCLDRRIDGAAAPFVLAADRGLYRSEGIEVTTTIATGSQDTIARLAKGAADLAVVDFNELIRYRDKPDTAALKAVFIFHNENGYAIVARRSRGVENLTDLAGKTLGAADGDLGIHLWPMLAKQNKVDIAKVKIEKIGAAVREPMLSAGQIDAVSGLSYASALNLRDRGIPGSDLVVLRFADFGDRSYGQAIVVNPDFAATKPEAVGAFLRALTLGIRLAVKEPARAIDDVMNQMDSSSRELERERLRVVLHDNIMTPDVQRDGLGSVSQERFDTAVAWIGADYKFRKLPVLAELFDGAFLPSHGSRKIN
ncbi:nitrate ABC transporter substrate-binding protein [Afipia sp. P52-10]|uniref:ABC transporter substrate-binding protein n=1 Tax=Afipia sp. P52-10 TaxID=1429916 RepID=UPI0003DEFE3D|nr:ABC transporter substrate-binding protein [Afipia sp. P52-10]ETR77350.1 nitrate ABC transporter substrate-binding protein [Afipia sp. P52-10]